MGTAGVLRQTTPTSTGGTDRSCGFGDWIQDERKARSAPRTGLFPGSSEAVFALCGDPPRWALVLSPALSTRVGGLAGRSLPVPHTQPSLRPPGPAGIHFPLCTSPAPSHSLGNPCCQPPPGRPLGSLRRFTPVARGRPFCALLLSSQWLPTLRLSQDAHTRASNTQSLPALGLCGPVFSSPWAADLGHLLALTPWAVPWARAAERFGKTCACVAPHVCWRSSVTRGVVP